MAAHFFKKLNIRGLQSTKHALSQNNSTTLQNGENLDDEYGKDFNIEMCMEAEASPTEADAILKAYSTDFVAGDTVGKLMAFISQIQASSEVTQVYLCELCQSNNCLTWEIKLWICTHWGSLSDCFRVVLGVQHVCTFVHFPILLLIFVCRLSIFCVLADENEDIPPLANGKNWSNFKLAGAEWQLIQLAYNCLVVHSDIVTFLLCFHLCWS